MLHDHPPDKKKPAACDGRFLEKILNQDYQAESTTSANPAQIGNVEFPILSKHWPFTQFGEAADRVVGGMRCARSSRR